MLKRTYQNSELESPLAERTASIEKESHIKHASKSKRNKRKTSQNQYPKKWGH